MSFGTDTEYTSSRPRTTCHVQEGKNPHLMPAALRAQRQRSTFLTRIEHPSPRAPCRTLHCGVNTRMVKLHIKARGYACGRPPELGNGTLLRRKTATPAGENLRSPFHLLAGHKNGPGCPRGSQGVQGVRERMGAGQEGSGLQPHSLPVQSPRRLRLRQRDAQPSVGSSTRSPHHRLDTLPGHGKGGVPPSWRPHKPQRAALCLPMVGLTS